MRDRWECRAGLFAAKAMPTSLSGTDGVGLSGVSGDGMPGKNVQRKLGTTRGSPRRSRTAKASRISRRAVKSRCACEWDGWGRLSDDGPGHYNPDPSEGPWGRWSIPPHGGALSSPQARRRADHTVATTRCTKGGCKLDGGRRMPGAGFKLDALLGRPRPKGQPSSRTGENSPYGSASSKNWCVQQETSLPGQKSGAP